jgi:predicted DNA-binding transcriptional regulator YafY
VTVTDEQFKKRVISDEENAEIQGYSKPFVDLHLRFSPEVLHRLYDEFDDSLIIKNTDGSLDVNVTFPEDEWVYSFILSFGNYVEVISPKHIRDIIADRMRKALNFYL